MNKRTLLRLVSTILAIGLPASVFAFQPLVSPSSTAALQEITADPASWKVDSAVFFSPSVSAGPTANVVEAARQESWKVDDAVFYSPAPSASSAK